MFDKFDIGIYSIYLYMKHPLFSGQVGAPTSYGMSLLQSPTQFLDGVGLKGASAP